MTIEEARRWYAEEIRAVAHLTSDAVVEAFARVPRETFLGAGPWQIARSFDQPPHYRATSDADPRHIYHNVLIAIDPARQLHNGCRRRSPSGSAVVEPHERGAACLVHLPGFCLQA
jgi:protein-L-isoaspartate(D-aspartate) O-methyltransferase